MGHKKRRYIVHLFVVGRLESAVIETSSSQQAVRHARNWYRRTRGDIDAGEVVLVDEISHYLVDQEGDTEQRESECFQAEIHPLLSPLRDLVLWSQGGRDPKTLEKILHQAREFIAQGI